MSHCNVVYMTLHPISRYFLTEQTRSLIKYIVPVILEDGRLKGIEAVIDKDRAACMMGKTLGANGLMILTDVPGVAINHGKTNEKWIKSASSKQMHKLADQFPDGSMGPKVSSAIEFVESGGWAMIGSLNEKAGTMVTNDFGPDHLEYY